MNLTLILADQLFRAHPALDMETEFLMVESLTECRRLPYHQFKLAYLLACMREYADYLRGKNIAPLHYFYVDSGMDFEQVLRLFKTDRGLETLQVCQANNKYFRRYLEEITERLKIALIWLDNPMFLTSTEQFKTYLSNKKQKRTQMSDFYNWQRKRLNILLDEDKQPVGGQWSYDEQNRQKLPASNELPRNDLKYESGHYAQAKKDVLKYFSDHPGQLPDSSWLPLNHDQAQSHLKKFLIERLANFGPYEDALSGRDFLLYHSALSSSLNYGLLTPSEVLKELNEYTEDLVFGSRQPKPGDPLNSIEGFIRQIIGWREWVKGMYDNFYDENYLNLNFFGSTKPLPEWFYTYDLPREIKQNTPLRLVLDKVNNYAFAHHIERLMVLGNWMTLNEYDPVQCYEWFASQFIDAFEWVMVPNVLGMGLFADGGLYATKPYISGGNYLHKMGDYPDAKVWEKLWTDKFWAFLTTHRQYFETQPRLGMLLKKHSPSK